jgi:O-succinylbenzoic acid--CoA ligase
MDDRDGGSAAPMKIVHDELPASERGIESKIAGVARCLADAGVAAQRPLGAMTASSAVLALLAHAAPRLGRALFPIDPSLPDAVVADLLDLVGADTVVGDRTLPGRTTIAPERILGAAEAPALPSRLADDDVALLIATSGSTGRPKAVMLTAGNLRAAAYASGERLPLLPDDRWLACMPLFHIGGLSILIRCALAGAVAVVHDRFDAARVAADLRDRRITHLSVVPTMLTLLLDAVRDGPPPASLRHVLVSGAALSTGLAQRALSAGWPINPSYGMSETASQLATRIDVPADWRQGHVGRPLAGAEVAIGEDGRLRVRGPMVMAGYANPELRPGDGLVDGWFTSNDFAALDAAGELIIAGRGDDVIVSGGKKIHPQLVEDLLGRCPGVAAAAVAGRPDPLWGEVLVAVFAGDISTDALLAWCREHLPSPLRPRRAVAVTALPQTSNGKLDRRAVRRLAE